jgi:hypothetical protein
MFDRKSRLMLMLGVLNDCYGDVRTAVLNLSDFIGTHPEFQEIDEMGVRGVLEDAKRLEEKILKVMDEIKKEIYSE